MRKIIIILLGLFLTIGLKANPIDTLIAKQVAKNWFAEKNTNYKKGDKVEIDKIFSMGEKSEPAFYIMNYTDKKGYIIISADDAVVPVLAYDFSQNYSTKNHPPAYDYWLSRYKEQIQYVQKNKIKAASETTKEWERLKLSSVNFRAIKSTKDISPLLKTEWDQDAGWNDNCPIDVSGPGGRVYAGCVATAMAQVLKYWNYPVKGFSSKSYTHSTYGTQSVNFAATEYNWEIMDNYSSTSSTSLLLYHCAVAVSMDFGSESSGAYLDDVSGGLSSYFHLSSTYKNGDIFASQIRTELDNGRPLIYGGTDINGDGGHAFVFDGYYGDDYFHINWGWSGFYNGYFYQSDLTPGSSNFSYYNEVIYSIVPNVSCNTVLSTAATGVYEDMCSITLSPGFSTSGDFRARIITTDKSGTDLTIKFSTPVHGHTELTIYNEKDEKISKIVDKYLFKDEYTIFWDKTNDRGDKVKKGNYYYILKTIGHKEKKDIVVK